MRRLTRSGLERGAVVAWAVGMVALVAVILLLAARTGRTAAEHGDLQAVADLAALAATDGGPVEARAVAADNGAVVVSFGRGVDDTVTVSVRRGGEVATASATRRPGGNSHPGAGGP